MLFVMDKYAITNSMGGEAQKKHKEAKNKNQHRQEFRCSYSFNKKG